VQSRPSGSRERREKSQKRLRSSIKHLTSNISALRLASISALKFEAIKKKEKFKNGGHRGGRHNWSENCELIRRSESGDRGGDELRRIDYGRHGPGVANFGISKIVLLQPYKLHERAEQSLFQQLMPVDRNHVRPDNLAWFVEIASDYSLKRLGRGRWKRT
jgi:hypothetical protein